MKKASKLISFFTSFAITFTLVAPANVAFAADEAKKVTILATSDVHANVTDYDYYTQKQSSVGFAKIYSVVKDERSKNKNVLLIDNGDTIQGTPYSQYYLDNSSTIKNPIINIMNFMKYDVMTLGNHEFNYGLPTLNKLMGESEFPMLAANIYNTDGTNFATPYVVKEVDGVKIAVLGLTTAGVMVWDRGSVDGKIVINDVVEEGKKWVKVIEEKEDVDAIIIAAHSGLEAGTSPAYEGQVLELAKALPQVTAIVAGHFHSEIVNQVENGVLIVEPKRWGERVSAIDLEFVKDGDGYKVSNKAGRSIDTKNFSNAPELLEFAKNDIAAVEKAVNTVIGYATEAFPGADQKIKNTALMDLIHDVQIKYGNADISIAASFNESSNIPKGDIKESSINGLYVYENFLNTTEMTGAQLKKYLEYCATYFEQSNAGDTQIKINSKMPGYNYDMVKGVNYTLDITKPVGERLTSITYKGKPVADDQVFKVAMNNYRFGGGGGHMAHVGLENPKNLYDSQAELGDAGQIRTLIKEYIKEMGTISPTHDNNYTLISALTPAESPTKEATREVTEVKEVKQEVVVEVTPVKINIEEKVYVVVSGDVLWKIAKENNTTWQVLAEYNKLENPHLIFPGQKILVPAA